MIGRCTHLIPACLVAILAACGKPSSRSAPVAALAAGDSLLTAAENADLFAALDRLPFCDSPDFRDERRLAPFRRPPGDLPGSQTPVVRLVPRCDARSLTEASLLTGLWIAKLVPLDDEYGKYSLREEPNYLFVRLERQGGRVLRAWIRNQASTAGQPIGDFSYERDLSSSIWAKWLPDGATELAAGQVSAPWVACTSNGCCCGMTSGSSCHQAFRDYQASTGDVVPPTGEPR